MVTVTGSNDKKKSNTAKTQQKQKLDPVLAVNPSLKHTKSSCTAILNKLVDPAHSVAAQDLVLTTLIVELVRRKGEITNGETFINALKKALD